MSPRARLVGALPAGRRYATAAAVSACVAAVLIVAQAELLATALVEAFDGRLPGAPLVAGLLAVVLLRAGHHVVHEGLAQRAASELKDRLRASVLDRARAGGPSWPAGGRRGELTVLLTRGLDALDPYVTGYLPALLPAVTVPLTVLIWLGVADWTSALVVLCTLPLVPVLGALVGAHTRAMTAHRWRTLERLGGHFADVVAGLPTLRMFGRARSQAGIVARIADEHRVATMRTLRTAFLSALVLELVASVSVALVAVPIGLRLLDGQMTLQAALVVLLLAPEAYLPLRALGTRFHAGAEGLAVAEKVFAVLDDDPPATPSRPAGRTLDRAGTGIRLARVTVVHPGRTEPALCGVDLHVSDGDRVAVVGPSGSGKSTLLGVVMGFTPVGDGRLLIDGADAATMTASDWDDWRARIGWIGQHPHLFADTLAANIALADPDAASDAGSDAAGDAVRSAARAALVDEFADDLPEGYRTRLGERGTGLSAGQRQRVALARAFFRDPPLLLLDEPTAHLDGRSEELVLRGTRDLIRGRTALFVTHREAMLAHATRVVALRAGRLAEASTAAPTGGARP